MWDRFWLVQWNVEVVAGERMPEKFDVSSGGGWELSSQNRTMLIINGAIRVSARETWGEC